MAGAGGFEPPVHGTKARCLTTWLRPKGSQRRRKKYSRAGKKGQESQDSLRSPEIVRPTPRREPAVYKPGDYYPITLFALLQKIGRTCDASLICFLLIGILKHRFSRSTSSINWIGSTDLWPKNQRPVSTTT